ncbi:MAG: hypothetical protein H7201_16305 [Candidatus Saccharibacteria bacterium]|nr:hypothetical protein [Microbacteriaceae bacterium]
MPIDPFAQTPEFSTLFVSVGVLVAISFAVVIALAVRSAAKVHKAGHDPLTLQADLAVRLLDSDALSIRKPQQQRLADIEALFTTGVNSESERATARATILANG